MTRLYVPATVRTLADLDRDGFLVAGADDVVVAPDDTEDAEYAALMTAAGTSAAWAEDLGPGERRRVVVVAAPPSAPTGPSTRVDRADVVAVHADSADVADLTDPGLLGDLCWYATQEIPALLG